MTRSSRRQLLAGTLGTSLMAASISLRPTLLPSFTAVTPRYIAGNALQPVVKPVLTQDVPSYQPAAALYATTGLKGAPHQFASAAHGVGTVYVTGQLDLYAPTSTKAGTYFTTLTFTAA